MPHTPPTELADIDIIVFDVDGVLTDGTLHLHPDGGQSKSFHLRDGLAMVQARRVGLEVAICSGRADDATLQRMNRLGLELVILGSKDKGADVADLAERAGVPLAKTAFVGDDLLDLPAMRRVGLAMCPADAAGDVKQRVHRVLETPGGYGVAREAIEAILQARGLWEGIVHRLSGEAD